MSTIKVNKIENTSTTDGGIEVDTSGHVTIDGLQMPTTGPLSNRNLIINGGMQVAQRGTSNTSQHNVNNYGVDRWQVVCPNTTAVLVHSQETTGGPDGFKNWLKISPSTADTSIAASDYSSVQQKIEGYNFISANYGTANAQNVTVSFKFKTNKAGTYCMCHRNAAADRNYIHEFTPVADGSWQTITYTVPGDTTGTWDTTSGIGWRFELFLANGTANQSNTTDTWFSGSYYHSTSNQVNFLDSTSNELGITGVQVELGDKSTPFEHRSYGDELRRCDRYCQVYRWGSQYEHICQGIISSGVELQNEFPLRGEMRTFPSCTISAFSHFRLNDYRGHDQDANNFVGIYKGHTSTVKLNFKKATSNMDGGRAGYMNVSTSAGGACAMTFSAEL